MKPHLLRVVLLLSFLLLAVGQLLAATRTYDAEAAAVPQIDSITVANIWAAGDTGSVTIGNATITFTCGSDTTSTAQVASVVKNMINATSIDNNLVGAETRSAAGQLVGEFRDVEAVIDPANSSKVLVRSRVAGVPFYAVGSSTLTVAESTAGSGTLTAASVQAASGPWHWDNAKNWSGNTLPVNDDTVEFRDLAHGPKYGLPNASLEVTIEQYSSFTGQIGLALKNANNYTEYRQRYVRLDDAGTGTNIQHRFGLGPGAGSPLINVRHATLQASVVIYATGTPAAGTHAVNIVCGNAGSTLVVADGSVDASTQDGTTAGWLSMDFGPGAKTDCRYAGPVTGVTLAGGRLLLLNTTGGSASLTVWGGVARVENSTATWNNVKIRGPGTAEWASTASITTLTTGGGGTFDSRPRRGAVTITNSAVEGPCTIRDPYERLVWTNATTFEGVALKDVAFELSSNFSLKITN